MWLFQGVLNAGLQILLSIFAGWLCARLKLVDPEVMSRNVNAFAMKAAYPAFIIHLLGIKTDLRDAEAWRALGVFVLWVFIIQLCCLIVHKLRGSKRSSVLQLGLNCLLLTTNNTGVVGWPVLIATVGQQSAVLSMLLGVLFFIQLLPVSICCFELHKWKLQAEGGMQLSTTPCADGELEDVHHGAAGDQQLPVTQCQQPASGGAFPHEFRYCYWSNELYQPPHNPPHSTSYALLGSSSADTKQAQRPDNSLAEVCVESGEDTEDEAAADHHCYGGDAASRSSRAPPASVSSRAAAAPGREWWRSGRAGRPQAAGGGGGGSGGLKRAKDSCDSLYTPFAAAAVAAKQAELEQQSIVQQRPSTLGLSSLTQRLSKGLTAAGAATAAAAASAVAAAAASPTALMRAVSLHSSATAAGGAGGTAAGGGGGVNSPMSRAASFKKAVSLKPALSLRRQQGGGGRDPLCQMSVPLMQEEHAVSPPSCCPSHRSTSPPFAQQQQQQQPANSDDDSRSISAEAGLGPAAAGGGNSLANTVDATAFVRAVSAAAPGGSGSSRAAAEPRRPRRSSGNNNSSSSSGDRVAATWAAGAGAVGCGGGGGVAAGRLSRTIGLNGSQLAADSAVELHCMCGTLAEDKGAPSQQPYCYQQQQQLDASNSATSKGLGAAAAAAAAGVGSAAAAAGGGAVLPSRGSAAGLHTLCCTDEPCGRFNSDSSRVSSRTNLLGMNYSGNDTARISSQTNLLPPPPSRGVNSKGASKLGRSAAVTATAAAAAGQPPRGSATKLSAKQQEKGGLLKRFVQRHLLLCHIAWNQLQSFHLWLNVLAIALSVSGARRYLDPQSPQAIPALGFVDGVLTWFSAACIPTLLFANGVWMCGKDVLCGGWRGQIKVMAILLLKLTLLPALMIGLTQACNIRGEYGLSLVLLASCPLAPLAFLVCQQYGFGAELATSITIQGVLLMLPQMMGVIKLNQVAGLYAVKMLGGK